MPADPNARTSYKIQVDSQKPPRFISMKWRILTPILFILMLMLMLAAYGIAYAMTGNAASQDEILKTRENVASEALAVGEHLRTEANRIAFTQDVPFYIQTQDGGALQNVVEPLAALAELDLVVVGNVDGSELLGLQRVSHDGTLDYAVASQTQLTSIQAMQAVLGGASTASNIVMVERRPMLVVINPVKQGETLAGVVLVGMDISRVLNMIQGDSEISLFGSDAAYLGSTLEKPETEFDKAVFESALENSTDATIEKISLNDTNYQTTYLPFIVGEAPLGVLAVYQSEIKTSSATQQMASLLAAAVMGAVCVGGYVSVTWQTRRIQKITNVADQLAAGEEAHTHMQARDEVSAMGVALDRYAAAAKMQVQQLQNDLRQERRQISHLQAILEGLPQGILIQDVDGRVLTMNGAARELLGVYGDSREAQQLKLWASQVSHRLGREIVPGVFSLGEMTQVKLQNKVLQVQAASFITLADKPVGTILMLHDVTDQTVRANHREAMLTEIAQDINVSDSLKAHIAETGLHSTADDSMKVVAQEIAQDSRAMQRMIAEYRDLTLLRQNELRERQTAINVNALVVSLMEEWRSLALGAGIDLECSLPDDDIYVLGDEKRLRMALGNLIDNSIKYSTHSAQVFIQAYPIVEESRIEFLIEDTGLGISTQELPHVFTRFYRGKPVLADGTRLKVPGSGQGLFLARQIIQAHGGQMTLTSKLGAGTQVNILLPLTADVSMVIEPASQMAGERISQWDQPTTKMRLEKHQR